jgi:predicted dehydrogenase
VEETDNVRLGLIGCSMHWRSYESALRALPGLEVAAVATAAPDERLTQFDGAPGVTDTTRRFDAPEALLAAGGLDVVQVSTRLDLIGHWARAALQRGVPVMAEKPLAASLDELADLHATAQRTGVPVCAMHAQRGTPLVAAVRETVQRGAIGLPLVAHNQKSYRWGTARPEAFKDRRTFPGISPSIGIHVFDWLLWILGDRFEEVTGFESAAARPEYACASHAAYLLRLSDAGMATVTMDYLRPEAAPTHGDERIRIAGTAGVVEISTGYGTGTLIDAYGVHPLDVPPAAQWYAGFLCAVAGERGTAAMPQVPPIPHVLPQWEVFRATEVALKTQGAVETGKPVDLRHSPYGRQSAA